MHTPVEGLSICSLFTRFPLSIYIYGRIAPLRPGTRYRGPCLEDAASEPVDVRTRWPPPPPAAVPGAYDWLLAEATRQLAQHKRPANQADIVKRCVAAVGGQIRETTPPYIGPFRTNSDTTVESSSESRGNPTNVSFDFVRCLISTAWDLCAQLVAIGNKVCLTILPNPDDRVTREAGAKALTDAGYPTSPSTLATKVSRGRGPRYRLYSGRAIYVWSDLLAWAESDASRSHGEVAAKQTLDAWPRLIALALSWMRARSTTLSETGSTTAAAIHPPDTIDL